MTHGNLIADELTDLKLNRDRQVLLGGDGDLAQIHGLEAVQQSAMLDVSNEIAELVGNPRTPEQIADVEGRIKRSLNRDPQLENVREVTLKKIDQTTNTVTFEVFVGFNNSFELPLEAQ